MALVNTAYDAIQDEYLNIRMDNERLFKERLSKTYESHPKLQKLDEEIRDLQLKCSLADLKGADTSELKKSAEDAKNRRLELISSEGIDPEYDKMIYTCPYCHDTGHIETEGGIYEKCRCFRLKESAVLLKEFGAAELLKNNNFSKMRTDVIRGENRDKFLKAVDFCKDFIDKFDTEYKNIMFFGAVGTGKSFLSCCIADELIKSYHSVAYMSAKKLFDSLADSEFSRDQDADIIKERIYESELLIIDDLGTEMTNNFTCSELFAIINERFNSKKSVIISTNLELPQIRDTYSDRIFSRIMGSYDILRLSGADIRTDIAIEK